MICDIARNLGDDGLRVVQELEAELGLTLVAFSCRELDPRREERLRRVMEGLGPVLQAEPATPDEEQLARLRAAEKRLGLSLVAVQG